MTDVEERHRAEHDLKCALEDWLEEQRNELPRASLTATVEALAAPAQSPDGGELVEPFQVRLRAPTDAGDLVPQAAATLARLAANDPTLGGRVDSAEMPATTAAPVEVDDVEHGGRAWELLIKVDLRARRPT